MRNKQFISIIVIFVMMAAAITASVYYDFAENSRVHQHLKQAGSTGASAGSKPVNGSAGTGFCTNLPIIIIDKKGQEIRSGDGEDAFIKADVRIIDNKSDNNHETDLPSLRSKIMIKYRGQSSLHYKKKQYLIKLITDDGQDNKQPVIGMSPGDEWVLNGSYIDNSLLRNYLAYNISGEIMNYAPNVRFCEVIMKDGSTGSYQGIYVMTESVDRQAGRLNLTKYDQSRADSSFIIRRDRKNDSEVVLNNYGTTSGLTREYLSVKYPVKSQITNETVENIENYISSFEKVLYSADKEEKKAYPTYIDVDSFVDYFIINEFFANYDAGLHSTYAYKEAGGKMYMGPVWDFDMSLDNYDKQALNVKSMAMGSSPWFDALVKDKSFVDKVISRYRYLRKGVLSEEHIFQYIDGVVSYIGDAAGRNAEVWGSSDYKAEVVKIKNIIHEHGTWMDQNIANFYNNPREDILPDNWIAVTFIVMFFIIIVLVRRN